MSGRERHRATLGAPDANAAALTKLYRDLGCTVADTHGVGFGFPDAVVGLVGVSELVEFKTVDGGFTPAQVTFNAEWRGALPIVVRTEEDVIAHVQSIRARMRRVA